MPDNLQTLPESYRRDARVGGDTSCARIPLTIRNPSLQVRRSEPVSVGVPLPRGLLRDVKHGVIVKAGRYNAIPCQLECLGRWCDGSVKWLLASLLVDEESEETGCYELRLTPNSKCDNANPWRGSDAEFAAAYGISTSPTTVTLLTRDSGQEASAAENVWQFPRRGPRVADGVTLDGRPFLAADGISLECVDARGRLRRTALESLSIEQLGGVRCEVRFQGRVPRCGGLRFSGRIAVYGARRLMRIETTLENPARAKHGGGCWELGDPGSVRLQGWRLALHLAEPIEEVDWMESADSPELRAHARSWKIQQNSSGGENWNSRNHVDHSDAVPPSALGYRLTTAGTERAGLRASPTVSVRGKFGRVTCALTEFWEKFPSSIECDGDRLMVDFWPAQQGVLQELQAGEHVTRVLWLRHESTDGEGCRGLSWAHEPLHASVDADWLATSDAIPWLPAPAANSRAAFQSIAQEAIDGPKNFFAKREKIDEFGWRHFGDLWADHEEASFRGRSPIISHYNNQYDVLHSFLIQYLLTGDRRWWSLADPLARHVMDIDVYHTDRDKSAYNGGLFWHTAHYRDAGTSTHRTYARNMNGPSGGPGNEHAYAAGLLLYYHLTGDRRARDTVLRLAEWIMALDRGADHVFGLINDQPTGRASCTADATYHGPGRGAGNAIGVLLDAWQVDGNVRYLDFADALIRRTIHPSDDVASKELNQFELRWSYSVYLLQLARYLHVTNGVARHGDMRAYVRESLLQYASWIAAKGLFSLDFPEQLEFPTETWAAQELRKGNVLLAAAQFSGGQQRAKLHERGREVLDRAWESLMTFESRSYTRPVAIVLQQAHLESYFLSSARELDAPLDASPNAWPGPVAFVPQREQVRHLLRTPSAWLRALENVCRPGRWYQLSRRSWAAEKCRRAMAAVR